MVATVALIVVAVGIVGPHVAHLEVFVVQSPPDLAALFAVGMLTAGIVGASSARRSWPWPRLALAAAVPVVAVSGGRARCGRLTISFGWTSRSGPALACLLAGLATGRPAGLLRVLDIRPMRRLGSFSYSLYLTHAPIVAIVCERIVAGRVATGVPGFLVSLALVLPLTIAFAWAFATVFEIPFQRPRRASAALRPPHPQASGVPA